MKFVGKIVQLLLMLAFTIPMYRVTSDIWNTHMRIHLERCSAECNKKYCNISHICRPINRTSKNKSLNIYFRPNVKLDDRFYLELITYKLFRTEYRQFMMHLKEELCPLLLYKNHSVFKLADEALMRRIKSGFFGNILDPCPLARHLYLHPRTTNSLDDAYHVPLIPIGHWKIEIRITRAGERILSFSDFYDITATDATEF